MPPSPAAPGTPPPSPDAAASQAAEPAALTEIVREIRDELAQITARELELRRRERELGRRYRSLKQATRQAPSHPDDENEQRLARLAAELNAQAVEVAARQARLDEAAEQLRARQTELDHRRDTPTTAAQPRGPVVDRTAGWWWRSTGLAAFLSLMAGLAWYAGHPPLYEATSRIRVVTERPTVSAVVADHRARLLDSRLLDALPEEPGLVQLWRQACDEGRVALRSSEDEPVLHLTVTADDAATAHRLMRSALTAYTQQLQTQTGDVTVPPGYRDLALWHERLQAALRALRQQQATDAGALATLPTQPDRGESAAVVDRLEAELSAAVAALDRQRLELAGLAGLDVPRGSVDAAQVEQVLAQDTIYQEDQQELRAAAVQYRTELGVATQQLDEPARAVQKALAQLTASLAEQRNLDPPADLVPVLDECAAAVSSAQARWTAFASQWRGVQETVLKSTADEDIGALVAQQTSAGEAADQIADETVALADLVGARIEELAASGDGSTRRLVVAAVLKADHDTLRSAVDAFAAAAKRTTLADNLQLDTLDRKLRGLRMRLNSRREAVGQQLQLEADRVAREQHTTQLAEGREQVRQAERRREELVADLAAALRQLRAAEDLARQRDEAAAQQRQRETEISWLDARLAEITRELADAPQRAPAPDRAEMEEPTITAVAPRRVRNAVLAGAATFGGVWLACALTAAGLPQFRRRRGMPHD